MYDYNSRNSSTLLVGSNTLKSDDRAPWPNPNIVINQSTLLIKKKPAALNSTIWHCIARSTKQAPEEATPVRIIWVHRFGGGETSNCSPRTVTYVYVYVDVI